MHKNSGSLLVPLHKFQAFHFIENNDALAVEEPLEIRLTHFEAGKKIDQTISITMRTPGYDSDLALGFLYTEGVIREKKDVCQVASCGPAKNQAQSQNIIRVTLDESHQVNLDALKRNSFTNSSCGVCGKTSLEALRTKVPENIAQRKNDDNLVCSSKVILQLPNTLRKAQTLFNQTGGVHASALFSVHGELMALREDVGRHNALDKLIGSAFQNDQLPLSQHILLVSGRVSFELVQKAAMAGIVIIAAVGAPSSLALELAHERCMTLIGFIRHEHFNLYCGSQRIQ